jgi:hypothetical protein
MNSANGQQQPFRIPDITEWFQGLSVDDRVLALTVIDEFFTTSVIRMQSKINKNGQGLFQFQSRVVKEPVPKGMGHQKEQTCSVLKQDFLFQSMKAILKNNKDQFAAQTK